MKCDETRRRLSAYQDRELPPGVEAEIRAHLKECPGCRHRLTLLKRLSGEIKNIRHDEPTANFTSVVLARIKEARKPRLAFLPSMVYSFIFILFFSLGLWLNRPQPKGVEPGPSGISMARVFHQSQNLSLSAIQDDTLRLLYDEK